MAALAGLGVQTDAVWWDDARVDWSRYGAIVLRSTWDYFRRIVEFLAWIDRLEAIGAPLWNRPATLRWNTDKRYLSDLGHPNLAPPPGAFFVKGARIDLAALLDARGWTDAVVKPTVSADGFSTERASRATAGEDQAMVDAMAARSDVMIQRSCRDPHHRRALADVLRRAFSHAVNKRPARGEFRVQERLGGVISPAVAPVRLVRHATGTARRVRA